MEQCELRISPKAFARLRDELYLAECRGHDPTTAARIACASVGYWPENFTETKLVVDYTLPSVIYPFQELCSEDRLT